ncbi:MAG: hypothetical protein WB676_26660, partial [Bryobacteraceae bacterium]
MPSPIKRTTARISRFAGLALLMLALMAPLASARVVIDSYTRIFVDEKEPGPIQKAVSDLARDCEAVFGQRLQVVHNAAAAAAGSAIWVALKGPLPQGIERPTGWERFLIQTVESPSPGFSPVAAVVLTGSDVRGTIYAIYQFSQQFLG